MAALGRGILVGLAMLPLVTGCAGSQHPELRQVTGRVVYQDAPVTDAIVAFYTEASSRAATGRTNDQGYFYLTTFEDNDGALPGEHTVIVTKTSAPEDDSPLSMDEAVTAPARRAKSRELLPSRYGSVDTSPLRFTITEQGPNDLTIELNDVK